MKKKNIVLLENSDSETKISVTFGIFNHSLFFYFEKIQQGIFIELARISEIEIQYQSNYCVNLVLRKNDKNNNEITTPLVFSKKERITTFLMRLSKTKKSIENHAKIKLTDFPIERIRLLKRKLLLYVDFTFVEPVIVEPKQTEYKEIVLSKDRVLTRIVNKAIKANDLSKLEKSQKVSKQNKNRNQHHQNHQQTQYRNHKRK